MPKSRKPKGQVTAKLYAMGPTVMPKHVRPANGLFIELAPDQADKFKVTLPDGTAVNLPITEWGMVRLRELLEVQAFHGDKFYGKVGSRQTPTQWAIDMFERKKITNPILSEQITYLAPKGRKIQKAELTLADLGFSDADIPEGSK